jgi:Arc/MetJ family transcription regulator
MPKSRHRKNHKKKVAARRQRLEQKRRAFHKKLRDQFGEEVAKELAKQQAQSGEEPEINEY